MNLSTKINTIVLCLINPERLIYTAFLLERITILNIQDYSCNIAIVLQH